PSLESRMPWPQLQRVPVALGPLQAPILVSIAYFLGAEIAFYIGTLSDKIFAPFWPPNVVLFCALLMAPERRWWVFIAAAFPAHVVAELGVGMPFWQLMVAFATNCAVATLNAFAVRRALGEPPWFGELRKAALYIVITAGISPAIIAFGGAFVPILGGLPIEKYWTHWTNWYMANVLTSLTLGPIAMTWLSQTSRSSGMMRTRRVAEALLLGVALIVICTVVFEVSAGSVATGFLPLVLYSPLPVILWCTFRFGEK